MQDVLKIKDADIVVSDQCQYGQCDAQGRPIKKPTKWLSNSRCIRDKLEKRCAGKMGWCSRKDGSERHVLASGKIARDAAIYPFQLCKAILEGLRKELTKHGRYSKPLALWAPSGFHLGTVEEEAAERMLVESLLKLQKHDGLPDVVDSASGQVLKGHLVGKARQEEMEYFFCMNVCTKVPEN